MTGSAPDRRTVAVVPARAGSRGLPGKNLMTVGGSSLVARAVRSAREAGIEQVVVSTDGPDIAAEAERLGATVVRRPVELSTGSSRTVSALLHVARALDLPDDATVVLLQPTSPLRTSGDVRAVLERHALGDVRTTLTVTPAEHHPYKQLLVAPDGSARPVRTWPDLEAPRQELPEALRINGAVYATALGAMRAADAVIVPDVAAIPMPAERSIDVDTRDDLERVRRAARDLGEA
ncbi:N-acylneuraminate cytidylyltransferase [Blastococcus sp. DSM 46786]|uniref:acylneuraminate cytidylyltransferase family protein n=1 Tax=Blastococcus sp. DSM 46786 TaxID=1798227 RepID=UPI0008C3A3C8|nr:acylneuraminate cytidylyltransferase family protein [Blastococcus sp. DSM 46786]SEK25555.1 N-acylneuraminate cytidylyltransferase [Blastococcus sp. DSM 46786]